MRIEKSKVILYEKTQDYCVYRLQIGKKGKITEVICGIKYNVEKHNRERIQLLSQLKTPGCALCGYNTCVAALDFHHVGSKLFYITREGIKNKSNQEIADEIAKCILLCANCHREVHHCD